MSQCVKIRLVSLALCHIKICGLLEIRLLCRMMGIFGFIIQRAPGTGSRSSIGLSGAVSPKRWLTAASRGPGSCLRLSMQGHWTQTLPVASRASPLSDRESCRFKDPRARAQRQRSTYCVAHVFIAVAGGVY